MAAQQVVRAGFRWRIGSGQSVQVWDDPWLPRPFTFRVVTPKCEDLSNLKVCDLIDPATKDWNISLVREVLWQEVAALILDLPLSAVNGADFGVWHHTANGKFSANVPGKIRVFIWKLAMNAIPTGANLLCMLPEIVSVCPFCQHEDEDIKHVFLRCPIARLVWCLSHLRWAVVSEFQADPEAWLLHMAECFLPVEFERAMTICWALWWNRNRALMERNAYSSGDLISFVLNYLLAYHHVNTDPAKLTISTSPGCWFPPDNNVIKLNFDGAMFATTSEIGIGIVARDRTGACVWWKSFRRRWVPAPELAEAFAARETILLARQCGWRRIMLEGDCASFHLKLTSGQDDFAATGAITRDIKNLSTEFDSCIFSLVRRTANKVAHCLARKAHSNVQEGPCFPPLLADLLFSDYA
ncbi:UNVERIFIED_CONTAM: hypothetical protein Sradi_3805400 [Sesamum radiatum]|uniref:Reverse transcriptase zinc-binding domain-containing protein n=1 Tax=Sesamum radiatum TaxID=300843 RepID=A0AAW2Q009_SESRA